MKAESIAKVEQMFSNNGKKLSDYNSEGGQTVDKRKIRQTDPDVIMELIVNSEKSR
ncbi:MAG: hypothetical protein WAL79_10830 [Nitrososphaeraceae archaeon]